MGDNLKAGVLKVGRHGSNSSSSLAFFEAMHPKCAVIEAGAADDHAHPSQTTLTRLASAGVTVHVTDCGPS